MENPKKVSILPPLPESVAYRTRFFIMLLVTLCLSITLSNTLTLNFTVICMAEPMPSIASYNATGEIFEDDNGTYYETSFGASNLSDYLHAVANRKYAYSPHDKNKLFLSVAIGAIIAVYPSMFVIQWIGSRTVVVFFGLLSAIVTALLPYIASLGLWPLIVLRVIQGTCLGPAFSVIGICTSQWSMTKQNAFFIAFLTCYFQFAPIFTMPVSGALCASSLGWHSVYYLHAAITVGLHILFYFFYREFPDDHFLVHEKELERIRRTKGEATKRETVPIRAILSSGYVYAIWVAAIANFSGIQITMQFSPLYLNTVMGFPVALTGLFSCIPQIVTFVVKMIAGVVSDQAKCCSPLTSVRIFNCLCMGGSGLFFIIIAFIPSTHPIFALVILICATSIIGFNCGAFFKASQMMARQHSHFIMGVNSFLNCVATLLAPVIVNIFVDNDTEEEWMWVWIVFGVLGIACNTYFCIFARVEPAPWTQSPLPSSNSIAPYKLSTQNQQQFDNDLSSTRASF